MTNNNSKVRKDLISQVSTNETSIDILAETVSNLSSATGRIKSNTVQVVGTTEAQLTFEVDTQSIDTSTFEFNDLDDTITFKKAGIYNFSNTLLFNSTTNNEVAINFHLRDTVTNDIFRTQNTVLNIKNGTSQTTQINTLLKFEITEVPKTISINHIADVTGIEITNYSSILTSGNTYLDPDLDNKILRTDLDITGFDRADITTFPVMEFCESAVSGEYKRITNTATPYGPQTDGNIITGQTTFGDGVTPLADNTFCIRPNTEGGYSEYSYSFKTVKKTISETKTLQLTNTVGKHIIVFNDTTLESTVSTSDAIVDRTICSVIYQNSLGKYWLFADEKHGKEMSGIEHLGKHTTEGCIYETGFDLEGIGGKVEAGQIAYLKVNSGRAWDEDIRMILVENSHHQFLYMINDGDWDVTDFGNSFGYKTTGNVLYNKSLDNGVWGLEELLDGEFCTSMFLTTNDAFGAIKKIVGQNKYNSIEEARDGIGKEMANINVASLPSPENIHLYAVIINHLGKIVTLQDGQTVFELRKTRYDFKDDTFKIPVATSAYLMSIPVEHNKIFWHKEKERYIVGNTNIDQWTYLAFDTNFVPPATPGTYIESWEGTVDDIKEKWTGPIADTKVSVNGKWSFDENTTGSSNTGPNGPQEGAWYIYTETSGGGDATDFTLETSYFVNLTEINFWYHCFGTEIGNVTLEYRVGSTWTAIWTWDGVSENLWKNHISDFTGLGAEAIRFRHNGASGYIADVAFDNIAITSI